MDEGEYDAFSGVEGQGYIWATGLDQAHTVVCDLRPEYQTLTFNVLDEEDNNWVMVLSVTGELQKI
jgi:hypothetical protein